MLAAVLNHLISRPTEEVPITSGSNGVEAMLF